MTGRTGARDGGDADAHPEQETDAHAAARGADGQADEFQHHGVPPCAVTGGAGSRAGKAAPHPSRALVTIAP